VAQTDGCEEQVIADAQAQFSKISPPSAPGFRCCGNRHTQRINHPALPDIFIAAFPCSNDIAGGIQRACRKQRCPVMLF
jgi:hypothetical protein